MSENQELIERVAALEEEMDTAQAMIDNARRKIRNYPFPVKLVVEHQLEKRQKILDLQRFKLKGAREYLIKNPE